MMEQVTARLALSECQAQRILNQGLGHVVSHRPTYHSAPEDIQKPSQVHEAFLGVDGRDSGQPLVIRLVRAKVSVQDVRRWAGRWVADGRAWATASTGLALQTLAAHPAGHALLATPDVLRPKRRMNPAHAIRSATAGMDGPDLLGQDPISCHASAFSAALPSVVTTHADGQHLTHDFHLKLRCVRGNERIFQPRSGLANTTAAFKMSRSWRATSNSRRNRLTSASSSPWWPFPTKARLPPPFNPDRHLWIIPPGNSKSCSIAAALLALLSYSRTVANLNACVYVLRCFFIVSLPTLVDCLSIDSSVSAAIQHESSQKRAAQIEHDLDLPARIIHQ
jgi:hypothetical protein